MKRLAATVLIASLACCFGCPPKPLVVEPIQEPKDYTKPLPPGALALRKLDLAEYPDFGQACQDIDVTALRSSVNYSLNYMSKPSSKNYFPYGQISHDQVVASLKAFIALLDAHMPPAQMNQAIRDQFDVYISVGCDDKGTVLFTGYYTPIFDASPVRTEKFKYPLYKAPANLVKDADGTVKGIQDSTGALTKLPDRKTIESTRMFAGNELYWLADPFEVYIAHVQGSVELRMPDGQLVMVGYVANNGWDYISVGKALIDDKKIDANKLSLQAMINYFKAHPNEVDTYVWRNPRFIFFTQTDSAARGSLNEVVMPYRSIATDKSIFPRASLAFIATELPFPMPDKSIKNVKCTRFVLDQDTGGAIRAPGRCDVYMGIGPDASELAGRTYREGKLYYLFLKPGRGTPAVLPPVTSRPTGM